MKRIACALAAAVLAVTVWYSAITHRSADDDTGDAEELPPIAPVYDDSDELATLNERRRAYEAEVIAVKDAELLAQLKRSAEREVAKAELRKRETVSRGGNYVGQAQSFTATAYSAYCDDCTGITRTGHDLRKSIYSGGRRVIATDPRRIPLGSIVRVTLADGTTFEAVASDIGGAIEGAIIDVAYETKVEAMEFGRQTVEIRMVRRGK